MSREPPDPFPQGDLAKVLDESRLRRILGVLNGDGEETRIVGGAVRNALLGLPVKDIDLTTTALPEITTRRAEAAGFKVVPTGIEHGTVTVIVKGMPFEVTTLREDVETDGRFAVVRYGRDFAADALRRDFTINALSVRADGEICDYTGGLDDIAARRVRFIGSARQRIREDYLRILRFFRFFAEYAEGPIDPEGLHAAISERRGLERLSRERIRTEFLRLMGAKRVLETAALIAHSGLLDRLTGGIGDLGRLGRVVANAPPDPVLRLAALDVMSTSDAERLSLRLRLSNAEGSRLESYAHAMAALKSIAGPVDEVAVLRLVAKHGVTAVSDAAYAVNFEPRPEMTPEAVGALDSFRTGQRSAPIMPLAGRDLMTIGFPKGPHIGQALKLAQIAWMDGGCVEGEAERKRLLGLVQGSRP